MFPISMFCMVWDWCTRFRHLRILKSWGGRYGVWLGVGWQSERTRLIERSWLVTVFPPYLRGSGISFSLMRFCVRGGGYKRLTDAGLDDEYVDVEEEIKALSNLGFASREKSKDTWDSTDERAAELHDFVVSSST